MTNEKKQQIMAENAIHEGDTGSPEVQIAVLTARINELKYQLDNAVIIESLDDDAVSMGSKVTVVRKNDKAKLQLQRDVAESNREVFLFNNNLEQIQQNENIARYRKLMADDEEIISLRSKVRKAAESKLSHGIIDVNDLVREINQENAARVQRSMHEIEMLKEIYDNKYTTNN